MWHTSNHFQYQMTSLRIHGVLHKWFPLKFEHSNGRNFNYPQIFKNPSQKKIPYCIRWIHIYFSKSIYFLVLDICRRLILFCFVCSSLFQSQENINTVFKIKTSCESIQNCQSNQKYFTLHMQCIRTSVTMKIITAYFIYAGRRSYRCWNRGR